MDITIQFNQYLAAKGTQQILPEPFEVSKLNGFMTDAYRINTLLNELVRYLRSIRSAYLTLQSHRSTTLRSKRHNDSSLPNTDRSQPFTEEQRKLVDEATRQRLTQISNQIRELSDTATLDLKAQAQFSQRKQSKRGLGALGRWAAGGAALAKGPEELEEEARLETEKAHREGLIYSLQMRLEQAGKVQADLVETRVKREIERSQNILSKSRSERFTSALPKSPTSAAAGPSGKGSTLSTLDLDLESDLSARQQTRSDLEAAMSPEQLQLLQSEQSTMLKQYNSELAKIQTAQTSLLEISSLQTTLTQNLQLQSENISQLVADSFETHENIERGNQQLKKAGEKFRPAQWVFWVSCGLGGVLVVWDLVF